MINKPRKYVLDNYYKKPNKVYNYSSILNSDDLDNKYYLNMINNSNNNYDYRKDDNFISKLHSDFFNQEKIYDYSPANNNFPIRKLKNTFYKNIYNINANTQTNSIKEFTLLDKSLSNLSLNKYRKMKSNKNFETEINDYQTIPNELLIKCHNSFNPYYINNSNRKESENKLYISQTYGNNGDSLDYDQMRVKRTKNLKNKIRLNKEINNYNKLEKKINKKIGDSYKLNLLNNFKNDFYTFNETIKYNNEENENKNKRYLINEYLLNSVKNNYLKSHKKLKRIKDDEDDISHQEKKMKRNTTFNYNLSKPKEKEKESDNINTKFIKYLKKDNQKLVHINLIYKQLIDTFFYFVNQLAQKYSFKKEIKNINYYINNANYLSSMLIDLEQHLNKMIKSYDINYKNTETENSEVNIEQDQDKELLNKSKFISINLENKIKQKPAFKTRNENYIKEFYSQNSKKGISSKKTGNRTMQNNSLNFLNVADRNEIGLIKMKSKINKNKKNNDRIIKMLNKLSGGRFSPLKQKNLNNKISFKNNK